MSKIRILILTSSTGGGHDARAEAFAEWCFQLYRHEVDVRIEQMLEKSSVVNRAGVGFYRYGIEGSLIDFGKETEVETKALIYELLDFVDDTLNDLGSRDTLSTIGELFKAGTGADRQLAVYHKNNSFIEVVDYIHEQFLA